VAEHKVKYEIAKPPAIPMPTRLDSSSFKVTAHKPLKDSIQSGFQRKALHLFRGLNSNPFLLRGQSRKGKRMSLKCSWNRCFTDDWGNWFIDGVDRGLFICVREKGTLCETKDQITR
jgi:hypothetical protein